MHSHSGKNEFFFGEDSVRYFEGQLPSSPGEHRYMPFRGLGHLRLVQALASSGSQRCHYLASGDKHYFTVERIPGRHVLEVYG
jgi:hypothetical protein